MTPEIFFLILWFVPMFLVFAICGAVAEYIFKRKAGELAFKGGGTNSTPRIYTPDAFRTLLLDLARTVK